MRVTAQTQAATRQRIRQVARHLFTAHGFEATTTRDIAQGAEIATGTMFNYFPSKEAVAADLAWEALEGVHREFAASGTEAGSLEEALFELIAAGLRKLKPLRRYLPAVLGAQLDPMVADGQEGSRSLRVAHLEVVSQLARRHGIPEISPVALHMYWSLYTGLLLFWAGDSSPKQENTLALLDHSLEMFVGWLGRRSDDFSSKPQPN